MSRNNPTFQKSWKYYLCDCYAAKYELASTAIESSLILNVERVTAHVFDVIRITGAGMSVRVSKALPAYATAALFTFLQRAD